MGDLELDRSVWLMLFCFPPDAKNLISLVDKSGSSFSQLIHVHRSSSVSRVIARVLVNKDVDVPDSVTVSVGTLPCVRTWIVPVFLLSATDVVLGGDEEPISMEGPTHPMPHPAPGWMGPVGPPAADVNMEDATSGAADLGDNMDRQGEREQNADNADGEVDAAVGMGYLNKSVFSGASADFAASGGIKPTSSLGPASALNQVISMLLSSLPPHPISICPFITLSVFVVDLSMQVPSHFVAQSDLWFFAKVVVDPMEVVLGEKRPRDVTGAASDDDDVRIVSKEEATTKDKTRCKRKARKQREPLGPAFVRRSKRTNKSLAGYRNKSSMPVQVEEEAQDGGSEQEVEAEVILEPSPLAVVPPIMIYARLADNNVEPAPFLNVDNVQAMAVGYLKMQPGSVFVAALLDSSDDE
ncbi:unnamed protein product [Urochloa humidicola]